MNETAQQYTQRILAHTQDQDPLKVQAATPKRLDRLVKGVTTAKLRKRPAPEKWSVAEILAHLADVEIVIGWRMRSILRAPRSNGNNSARTPSADRKASNGSSKWSPATTSTTFSRSSASLRRRKNSLHSLRKNSKLPIRSGARAGRSGIGHLILGGAAPGSPACRFWPAGVERFIAAIIALF